MDGTQVSETLGKKLPIDPELLLSNCYVSDKNTFSV